ncbi:MAG: DUF1836 domain-containing protein [Firmicutes bacterium]|nr:DUF1836 domain-containing protein [Bacillota bacterium]
MQDLLKNIHQYNKSLTISQTITFFARGEIFFTKSMIQNYVRDGILPPPKNKRYYTHEHLAVLAIVNHLKSVYDMSTIKIALLPFVVDNGIPLDVYQNFLQESTSDYPKSALALMLHSADIKQEVLKKLEQTNLI